MKIYISESTTNYINKIDEFCHRRLITNYIKSQISIYF